MKPRFILYPYLITIYPVLYLYSRNVEHVPFYVTLLPLAVLVLMTMILQFVGTRLHKDEDVVALNISIFFIWLFSYSAVRSLLMFEVGGWKFYRHRYFIVIWLILLLVVLLGTRRFRFDYRRARKFVTIVASLLVLFSVLSFVQNAFKGGSRNGGEEVYSNPAVPVETEQSDSLPDIYYIILDAYTGEPGLQKYLDIDNREFLSSLRDKGFYVARTSHSNYAWTILSLASSLNMEYLGVRPDSLNSDHMHIEGSGDEYRMIVENRVMAFLRARGYESIDMSIWKTKIYADPFRYTYQYVTNDFNLALLRMTLLERPIVENYLLGKVKHEKIIRRFEELRSLPPSKAPRFVYAHFLVPHHPYVFDRDGDLPPFSAMAAELQSEKVLYHEQLLYVNKEILRTVDTILAKAKRKPIIILQGDHGAYQLADSEVGNKKLRMSILNAYYVPDSTKRLLYESISPVNTFRVIFNSSFGQEFDLLPDKSYFSRDTDFRTVEDVTSLLAQ